MINIFDNKFITLINIIYKAIFNNIILYI